MFKSIMLWIAQSLERFMRWQDRRMIEKMRRLNQKTPDPKYQRDFWGK